MAVVSADAFGGWKVIWREMEDAGLPPARLGGLVETGFPMESVVEAVRSGRAAAGVLRACVLEDLIAAGRVRPDEFTVVGERSAAGFPCRLSSRLYPDWPFARLAGIPPDLAKAVTSALLAMPAVDGRAWTAPQDYTGVHALFRQLKIGPYDYLAHVTLSGFLRAQWPWLLAGGVAAAWWVVHVARVETLVRRRTAELTREIQSREMAEDEARRTREQRDQFSRLGILGEMASNIAHELNQPLAAIANYAEGMTHAIDRGRSDAAFLRAGARGIAGEAERAGAIIQRIRAFQIVHVEDAPCGAHQSGVLRHHGREGEHRVEVDGVAQLRQRLSEFGGPEESFGDAATGRETDGGAPQPSARGRHGHDQFRAAARHVLKMGRGRPARVDAREPQLVARTEMLDFVPRPNAVALRRRVGEPVGQHEQTHARLLSLATSAPATPPPCG